MSIGAGFLYWSKFPVNASSTPIEAEAKCIRLCLSDISSIPTGSFRSADDKKLVAFRSVSSLRLTPEPAQSSKALTRGKRRAIV